MLTRLTAVATMSGVIRDLSQVSKLIWKVSTGYCRVAHQPTLRKKL